MAVMDKKKQEQRTAIALGTWLGLQDVLRSATEEELEVLIELEKNGRRRINYLLRLYGRYNILRTERERRELLSSN